MTEVHVHHILKICTLPLWLQINLLVLKCVLDLSSTSIRKISVKLQYKGTLASDHLSVAHRLLSQSFHSTMQMQFPTSCPTYHVPLTNYRLTMSCFWFLFKN
jgi:hypothetical protein